MRLNTSQMASLEWTFGHQRAFLSYVSLYYVNITLKGESYLIPFRIGIQGIFSSQHSGREHDTKEDHITEDTVIAQPVTKDAESEKRFKISVKYWLSLLLSLYKKTTLVYIDTQTKYIYGLLQLNYKIGFVQSIFL